MVTATAGLAPVHTTLFPFAGLNPANWYAAWVAVGEHAGLLGMTTRFPRGASVHGATGGKFTAFAELLLQQFTALDANYGQNRVMGNLLGTCATLVQTPWGIGVIPLPPMMTTAADDERAPGSRRLEQAEEDAYSCYVRKVEELDVSTAENQAIFYSERGVRQRAEAFSSANRKLTLGMTPGGVWLEQADLVPGMEWRVEQMSQWMIRYSEGDRSMDIEIDWRDQSPAFDFACVSCWAPPHHQEVIPRERQLQILKNKIAYRRLTPSCG